MGDRNLLVVDHNEVQSQSTLKTILQIVPFMLDLYQYLHSHVFFIYKEMDETNNSLTICRATCTYMCIELSQ